MEINKIAALGFQSDGCVFSLTMTIAFGVGLGRGEVANAFGRGNDSLTPTGGIAWKWFDIAYPPWGSTEVARCRGKSDMCSDSGLA